MQCFENFGEANAPPLVARLCGTHPIKLIVTWLCPDQAIKGKSRKRFEK